jgi:hypothetical protein
LFEGITPHRLIHVSSLFITEMIIDSQSLERIEVEVSEVLSRQTPQSLRKESVSSVGTSIGNSASAVMGAVSSAVNIAPVPAPAPAPPVQHSNLSEFGLPLAARKVYFGGGRGNAATSTTQVPPPPGAPGSAPTAAQKAAFVTGTTYAPLSTETVEQRQQQQRSGGGSLRNTLPRLIPPKDLVDDVKEYKKQLKM